MAKQEVALKTKYKDAHEEFLHRMAKHTIESGRYPANYFPRVWAIVKENTQLCRFPEGYHTIYTAFKSVWRGEADEVWDLLQGSDSELFIAGILLKAFCGDSYEIELARLIRNGLIVRD
jgi:hypothetical protein